jgi:hypothetical protein
MKKTFHITRLAASGALAAAMLLTGCGTPKETHRPATMPAAAAARTDDKATPQYVTTEQVKAMPPCTATFARRLSDYSGSFTTADGKQFVLGDIRGEQWVWHFVCAVKEGKTYPLPAAFENYMNARHYVTAKEIAAMPPCTGTLASRTPCSSYFSTADGKWFGIGDPGSGVEISDFIWSLKDGETCTFPATFLAYQKLHQNDPQCP